MMVLVDTSYCSSNTTRRRMDLSARQKNTNCNDDMKIPASKRSTKYHISYELWTNSISDEKAEYSVG